VKQKHPVSYKLFNFQSTENKFLFFRRLKVNAEAVRVGGEEFDLMVQIQRKQLASLFPVSHFRNLSSSTWALY